MKPLITFFNIYFRAAFGLILLLAASLLIPAKGQNMAFLGSGLNVSYIGPDSLNYVVHRFNETRGAMSKNLSEFHFPLGMNFEAGVLNKGILYDISWVGRTITSRARFNTSGSLEDFHLKLRANSLNLGLGYAVHSSDKVNIIVGGSIDGTIIKASYRYGPTQVIKQYPYDIVVAQLNGATTLFTQFIFGVRDGFGVCAILRPYVQVQWLQTDFFPVNQAINPNSYFFDPPRLGSRVNNFGISLTGVYYFAVKE